VNVLHEINEVINSLSFMQGFAQTSIDKDVPQDLVIITDRERLKVIISNLISNAVKYRNGKTSSFIRICSKLEGQSLVTSVEDNGIGISDEHQTHVFEMFYQAHETAQGSGLGLYIVNEAIQKLGGRITVSSIAGKGSTFTFRIPGNHGTTM
jgi:signal transduction histidine kinase